MSDLKTAFPRLRDGAFVQTSQATPTYNCVAWAAGDDTRWWWPIATSDAYWPAGAPQAETLGAFEAAFGALGYERCADQAVEPGWTRVAFFTAGDGTPTHVARQLVDGRWTSKLGRSVDIAHDLDALEGDLYGRVALVMRRRAVEPER